MPTKTIKDMSPASLRAFEAKAQADYSSDTPAPRHVRDSALVTITACRNERLRRAEAMLAEVAEVLAWGGR